MTKQMIMTQAEAVKIINAEAKEYLQELDNYSNDGDGGIDWGKGVIGIGKEELIKDFINYIIEKYKIND